ncbi:COX5B-domain-containing protein [Conidiobolus coronatus NRRL 28638]|uniref:COX5B-domain-containing protein n=1 Tax=Conidiobolus coronatus (strain ATCC 28846 / CBS 209.66 / NRRL 28638) TaxID=796925 RepID=A0A137NPA7_CONC2|nr:COX5B-domain-containing protein [Conidiobolus coronatus NRRL 28638]|eukprot:KXN64580.1 COX5B-domain-containing protein [Conidiobolus coronatus NRRL 28638]
MLSKLTIQTVSNISRQFVRSARLTPVATRAFSVATPVRGGDHGHVDVYIGSGAQSGKVPTDIEQAVGLERVELLAEMEGREFWDMAPLEMTHFGTKKNPIVIESQDQVRYVGCTGYPADSHDTIWLNVDAAHDVDRCPECGCCYKLKLVDQPEIPEGALFEDAAGQAKLTPQ